jgi:hypothetical protein
MATGVTMTSATPSKHHAPGAQERAQEDWLRKQAAPAYDAYRADPSRGLSLEDVRASISKR